MKEPGLGESGRSRRRPVGQLDEKTCDRRQRGWLGCHGNNALHRQLQADQRNHLNNMVRCAAQRAVSMIGLSVRMRVRDLNDSGEQDKRNTQNAHDCGEGSLWSSTFVRKAHVNLNIVQTASRGKAILPIANSPG
jgi:hypothetical protein